MLEIERQFNGDQLKKVCDFVGWESDFDAANFETGHYYLIKQEKEPVAMVICTPMAGGVLECHIAKRDTIKAFGLKNSANIIIEELAKDYDALFCLIEKNNKAARFFVNRIGFKQSGTAANYKIYTRGL